jgi:tetratricopeptide (TPR) repeat protein
VKTAAVVVFTFYCLVIARKRPVFCSTWFSFLIPLLPVLAFTQSADDTAIASRYSYLPSVAPSITAGIILVVAYKASAELKPKLVRFVIISLMTVIVFGYGAMTLRLISVWQDSGTLWTRQIEIMPLGRAYTFRGRYYYSTGKYKAALNDFSIALKISQQAGREEIFNIYAYRGETLRTLGLHEEAITDFTAAINLSAHPLYFYYRGCAFKALGRLAEAEDDFSRAGNHSGPIPWFSTKYR